MPIPQFHIYEGKMLPNLSYLLVNSLIDKGIHLFTIKLKPSLTNIGREERG